MFGMAHHIDLCSGLEGWKLPITLSSGHLVPPYSILSHPKHLKEQKLTHKSIHSQKSSCVEVIVVFGWDKESPNAGILSGIVPVPWVPESLEDIPNKLLRWGFGSNLKVVPLWSRQNYWEASFTKCSPILSFSLFLRPGPLTIQRWRHMVPHRSKERHCALKRQLHSLDLEPQCSQ